MQSLQTQIDERDRKPNPHARILEQRRNLRHRAFTTIKHSLGQLHHRVSKALVHGPLSMQNTTEADQHATHYNDEAQPIHHGRNPCFPRYRSTLREAFIIPLDCFEVLRHHPRRDKVEEQFVKSVLWSSVVERIDDCAYQKKHQSPSRHGNCHQQHAINKNEIRLG